MKNLRFAAVLLLALALSSCFDIEEKIQMNADNSGTYSMTIDLGRLLKMSGSMGGDRQKAENAKEKKDTTIYLKDLIKSADNLTPSEKELYKDGLIRVNLDEPRNEMKIVMSAPFQNAAALSEIKNNFSNVMNKLKAFEKATGEKEKEEESDEKTIGARSVNPVGDQFTFSAVPGKISNRITDLGSFKHLVANDSTLSMMTQMAGMMGDFNYRTQITLPHAVKKYNGPAGTLSPDKKTVSFSTTLAEMLEHPEKVSYSVEY